MLIFYVIGLPVAALLRVRNMHRTTVMDPEEEKIYGMFYTAFRKETWWWEITVAARKIVIALIGVFGAEMGDMQVHLTAMLVFLIVLITSQIRPFGGLKHGILHVLEMASLMVSRLGVIPFFLILVTYTFGFSPLLLRSGHVFNIVGGLRVQHPSKM